MFPSTSAHRNSNRRAFTLVELLVVIGIIALLISMLLPALNKARQSARTVTCLSTVRQLGMAYQMYTNAHRRSIPFYQVADNGIWIGQLKQVFSAIDKHRLCPEAMESFGPIHGQRTGTAFHAWGPSDLSFMKYYPSDKDTKAVPAVGSYGFNGWLYAPNVSGSRGSPWSNPAGWITGGPAYPSKEADWYRIPIARGSHEVPVFADAIWPDGWPRPDDKMPMSLALGGYIGGKDLSAVQGLSADGSPATHMGRFVIARHGKAVNVVFADGHAATVPLPELWTLRWSARWVAPDPLPTMPASN